MCLESLARAGQKWCTDSGNDNDDNGTFSYEMIRPGYANTTIWAVTGLSKSVFGR